MSTIESTFETLTTTQEKKLTNIETTLTSIVTEQDQKITTMESTLNKLVSRWIKRTVLYIIIYKHGMFQAKMQSGEFMNQVSEYLKQSGDDDQTKLKSQNN